MNPYLPSLTNEELIQHAEQQATTELEKELLKRLIIRTDACGVDDDVCQCCGSPV